MDHCGLDSFGRQQATSGISQQKLEENVSQALHPNY
jgi:hypothetical protein